MSRNSTGNLAWVDAIGLMISKRLTDHFGRPIVHLQSGPYNQGTNPPVGIFFNDPLFHFINPVDDGDSRDFRFGYYIDRSYHNMIGKWVVNAGFEVLNTTLTTRFFMKNIRAGLNRVAMRLHNWLNPKGELSFMGFGLEGESNYRWDLEHPLDQLIENLETYGNLGRRKKDVRWAKSRFYVGMELEAFRDFTEDDLLDHGQRVAKASEAVFKELAFIYNELFPRTLDPARLSNGQSRALLRVQPDRLCAWDDDTHCRGQSEAAHIKPDRLGGPAVAANLIWLCQFHHRLLDTYLGAAMNPDPRVRRIIASVTPEPPLRDKLDGLALTYWNSISNKDSWLLPLKHEAIVHIFT